VILAIIHEYYSLSLLCHIRKSLSCYNENHLNNVMVSEHIECGRSRKQENWYLLLLCTYPLLVFPSFNLHLPSFHQPVRKENMAWTVTTSVTTVWLRHVTRLMVYVRLKTRVNQVIWVQSAIKVFHNLKRLLDKYLLLCFTFTSVLFGSSLLLDHDLKLP